MRRFLISIRRPITGRVLAFAFCPLLVGLCCPVSAQQVYRIGYLSSGRGIEVREEAFRQALRDLGYIKGQNLVIEWRFAQGSARRRPELAAELVRLKVDCILAAGSGETQIAQKATREIPIVMMASTDPVGTGFVDSLARPGANITGLTSVSGELGGKLLELLKETIPRLSRVVAPEPAGGVSQNLFFKETEMIARALGLKLIRIPVRGSEDFDEVFRTAIRERADALLNRIPPTAGSAQRQKFVDLAMKLPAIYIERMWADVGGLMSYGPDRLAMDRRAAWYMDKILKGAKPGEMPVEAPSKFELVVNLKTAKQIGVTIPPNVLARADRVIR